MSKERRYNQIMRDVDNLELPTVCDANLDTVKFSAQIEKLHGQFRANVLSAKTQEQAEMYQFYVAVTGKMLVKLVELAKLEYAMTLNAKCRA